MTQLTFTLTADQIAQVIAENTGAVPVPPTPPVTGDGIPKVIGAYPVTKMRRSVDPQRSDPFPMASLKNKVVTDFIIAVQNVTPETLDPKYAGPFKGIFGNAVSLFEFSTGQRADRQSYIWDGVLNLSDPNVVIPWSNGNGDIAITPSKWILYKNQFPWNPKNDPSVNSLSVIKMLLLK